MLPLLAASAAGSLIQGGINALAAKQNYKYSRALADQQFEHQKMLNDLQNDWNLQQWNRENKYNDYSSQVERMEKAGLNPAMMFGQSSPINSAPLESANSSVPSSPVADFMRAPDAQGSLLNVMNQDIERKRMELQDKMLDKQLKRTDRQLDINDKSVTSQAELNEILGRKADAETNYTKELENKVRADVQVAFKSIETMDTQIENYRAQTEQYRALAEKAKEERNFIKYNAITQRMNAQSQRIVANATKEYYKKLGDVSESQVKLNEQNVKNLCSALAKTDQETKNLKQQFEFNGKSFTVDLEIKKGQCRILDLQGDSQELSNKLQESTYYADVADAYINTVSNAANAVSDCTAAFVDVSTAGATTVLRGQGAVANQKAQTGLYNSGTKFSSFSYGL